MDTANGLEHAHRRQGAADGAVDDQALALAGDERRMHVRAYNHWVSLLKGRPYPPIDDLDPASIADFGPNSVLLDFTGGIEDPKIAFLGGALREECGLDGDIRRISDVPARSLLSRLTDHYLQIIANRAPIGFEAEFVGTRGRTTLYRGILMPFSSEGTTIDFIYGVINWKELVDADTQASLTAELEAAVRAAPPASNVAPIWADGPGVTHEPAIEESDAEDFAETLTAGSLANRLMLARESAAQVRASDARSRSALYRALARAHDFGLAADEDAEGYASLLAEAGLTVQARAPMTPIAKLVFGADYDKTRLTEYAAVLAQARRHEVPAGDLVAFLDTAEGGIKGLVAAERAAKRPAAKPDRLEQARASIRNWPPLASVAIPGNGQEFVVLLARANGEDRLDIVARLDSPAVVDAVTRRVA